ncbi:hypothetical protein J6590_081420 [Homalodisca vitripennis]|nr:hypothetical protein J6590_081420 [Homalodisca vitripennis]
MDLGVERGGKYLSLQSTSLKHHCMTDLIRTPHNGTRYYKILLTSVQKRVLDVITLVLCSLCCRCYVRELDGSRMQRATLLGHEPLASRPGAGTIAYVEFVENPRPEVYLLSNRMGHLQCCPQSCGSCVQIDGLSTKSTPRAG